MQESKFPLEIFPTPLQDLILNHQQVMRYPVDYFAVSIISAIATSIGKSAKINITGTWNEFSSFSMILVGNAGANKSHPLSTAFEPLIQNDKREIDKFSNNLEKYYEIKKPGVSSNKSKPVLQKTVLFNFTPEALLQRLNESVRGCVVNSDEIVSFLEGINNYSKNDQTSMFLSIFSSKPISVDRVKNPVPLLIPQPFLNIIGTIQPRILAKQFSKSKIDNGFFQRFLFAYPMNVQKQPLVKGTLDTNLLDYYKNWINNYIEINPVILDENGIAKSKIYQFSEKAFRFFEDWYNNHIQLLHIHTGSVAEEVINKFEVHFVRLALLIQIMHDYKSDYVNLNAAQSAALLCEYFLENGLEILERIENEDILGKLNVNKKMFYESLPDRIESSEAIEIGLMLGISKRTIQRLIYESGLFKQISQGLYEKINLSN